MKKETIKSNQAHPLTLQKSYRVPCLKLLMTIFYHSQKS